MIAKHCTFMMRQIFRESLCTIAGGCSLSNASHCMPHKALCALHAAPTVVLWQHYDSSTGCACPEAPESCALVFPRAGNLLLFDGALGHGVLESVAPDERMTLLINWWAHQPQVRGIIPLAAGRLTMHIVCVSQR